LGLIGTAAVWVDVIVTKPAGRNLGFLWMGVGLVSYLWYRRQQRLPAAARVEIEKLKLPDYQPVPDVQAIRERLGMSQPVFAATLGVPVATLRNWEQRRTGIAPSARTLLRVLEREPEAVLQALQIG
jgi:DNA-binding transcriptional regulator YiaG